MNFYAVKCPTLNRGFRSASENPGSMLKAQEAVPDLCFSIFLGVVELLFKTDHKLTHGLFPILDRHRPALADIA